MKESKELGLVAGKYFAAAVGFGAGIIATEWLMKWLSPKATETLPAPAAATDTKKKASQLQAPSGAFLLQSNVSYTYDNLTVAICYKEYL